ncbi:MAG: type II toxin-antitoxin system VapC family toxin [Candidatus Eisenbacteria bacterium]|uniref:Ribonuclease VapC n=1 Tax=Eiseniibacteriota bacterium TaxID=2212470 RepID=A0A538TXU8_UNCEI|nr:MAG: type II toxin-antitoxin system VapC family toxin [Candidatus Eisenbacteria bacterium]
MIAVDTGILAFALNRWAPEHARASRLVEGLLNGDRSWAVTWPALHELIARITHRHGVARPLASSDAADFVEQLLESPALRALGPTPRHASVMREVLEPFGEAPPPPGFDDAVLLREHGVRELLSTDAGMRRFGFLSVIDPFQGDGWRPEQPPARRYRRLTLRGGG